MHRFLIPWVLPFALVACGDGPSGPTGPEPASITALEGDNQESAPGTEVPISPAVSVRDAQGQPLEGALVTFAVEDGGGVADGDTVRTDSDGLARVGAWQLGPLPSDNRLTASVGALPPVSFTATGRFLTPTALVPGTVSLPQGSSVVLDSLTVVSGLTEVPVGSNGAFVAAAEPNGSHFAGVVGPGDTPILLGWLGADERQFSPRSTAEVLVYFDIGAYLLMDADLRREAREALANDPTLDPLEDAIAAAIAGRVASPLEAPGVIQARAEVLEALRATAQASSGPARGVIVDPSGTRQSGVEVGLTGLNQIMITNNFRRHVAAFVDRISYLPKGGDEPIAAHLAGAPIKVSAVSSATSPIAIPIDALTGGTPGWIPVVSAPVPTPVFPENARSTLYRVTAVGLGGESNPQAPMTPEQEDMWMVVSTELVFLDVVLPMIDQVLAFDNLDRGLRGQAELQSLIHRYFDAMPNGYIAALNSGNLPAAVTEAAKLLLDTGVGQEILAEILVRYIHKTGVPADVLAGRVKSLTRILTVVEIIATGVDFFFIGFDVGRSRHSESWEVTATNAAVSLVPEAASISQLGLQLFEARIVEAADGGSAPVFRYRWSTTGKFGQLCGATLDGDGGCRRTPFTSSREEVSYLPDGSTEGTDQVHVQIYTVVRGVEHVIGEATSNVTVYAPEVSILPEQASIKTDESVTFRAEVDEVLQDGGTLAYRWTSPENFGELSIGGQGNLDGQLSPNSTALYTAGGAEGTETVTVEIVSIRNGVARSLGTDTATILIEQDRPTIVSGSWTTITTGLANNRSCVVAFLTFPIVQGAKSYSVHAHGFSDTFWGPQFNRTFTPPFPAYRECAGNFDATSGVNGGQYFFYLSGYAGSDPGGAVSSYNTRFGGMVVEVTVQY